MAYAVSLADLRRAGLAFTADEVVAIAEQLIHRRADEALCRPFGPLDLDRVRVVSDGSIRCLGCDATPSVAELAILLQRLLEATSHAPGGLRYAVARALHEVDAPPFDSLEEFWLGIARFAQAPGDDTLRRLIARWDRRRPARSTSELRLQLRDADRRLYEAQARVEPPPREVQPHRRWVIGALLAAAVTTIASASVVGDRAVTLPVVAPPPAVSAAVRLDPLPPETITPIVTIPASEHVNRAHPKRPIAHPRTHALRLRWLHTTVALKDDLAQR